MEDREDLDDIGATPIDNSIRPTDYLANLGILEFRNDPARVRKASYLLDCRNQTPNHCTCVVPRVSSDEVLNRLEIFNRLKGPTDSDHDVSRALTSS